METSKPQCPPPRAWWRYWWWYSAIVVGLMFALRTDWPDLLAKSFPGIRDNFQWLEREVRVSIASAIAFSIGMIAATIALYISVARERNKYYEIIQNTCGFKAVRGRLCELHREGNRLGDTAPQSKPANFPKDDSHVSQWVSEVNEWMDRATQIICDYVGEDAVKKFQSVTEPTGEQLQSIVKGQRFYTPYTAEKKLAFQLRDHVNNLQYIIDNLSSY